MPDKARSYTTIEVAKRLGVSLPTVQRWVDAGHLKAWKTLGGHRRIDAQSAEALFAAQEAVAEAPAGASTPAVSAAPPATVLIVEDDAIDRELLGRLVRKTLPQAQIVFAENGFQGLLMAGRVSPRVVVTDIEMPHMNGLEMIRQLLTEGAGGPQRVLAVSAHLDVAGRVGAEWPAGVRFFSKPVDEPRFAAALQGAAGHAGPPAGDRTTR